MSDETQGTCPVGQVEPTNDPDRSTWPMGQDGERARALFARAAPLDPHAAIITRARARLEGRRASKPRALAPVLAISVVLVGIAGTTFAALGGREWVRGRTSSAVAPPPEDAPRFGAPRSVDVARTVEGHVEALEREATVEPKVAAPTRTSADEARTHEAAHDEAARDEAGARERTSAEAHDRAVEPHRDAPETRAATSSATPPLEHRAVPVDAPATLPRVRVEDRPGPWSPPRDAIAPDPLPLARDPTRVGTKPRGVRDDAQSP
jgi:hypothetical protein